VLRALIAFSNVTSWEYGIKMLVGEVADAGPEELLEGRTPGLHAPARVIALDGADLSSGRS
jgi:hypothetical protein